MNLMKIGVVLAATSVIAAGAAFAVDPAYNGPMGNPEEPALRPVKNVWQGIKSLVYRPVRSFGKGNLKTPVLGSAEAFRGLRRGLVGCGELTVEGVLCSVPPRDDEYKELGKVNNILEEDIMLRNAADFVVSMGVFWPVQKVVDHYPVHNEARREAIERRAKAIRKIREKAEEEAEKREKSRVSRAQEAYLGDRARINDKPFGKGNILKEVQ